MSRFVTQVAGDDPKKHLNRGAAVRSLLSGLDKLASQFRNLDPDVVERCALTKEVINAWPPEGGAVDLVIDEYSGVRYQSRMWPDSKADR